MSFTEVAIQKNELPGLPNTAAHARASFFREFLRLFFIVVLLAPKILRAGDVYDAALDQRFAEARGSTNEMRAAPIDPHIAALERALKAEQQHRSQGPPAPPPVAPMTRTGLIAFGASLLAAILALIKAIHLFNHRIKQAAVLARESAERALREKNILEEPSVASFFIALRQGLETSTPAEDTGAGISLSQKDIGPQLSQEEQARQLKEFFASAHRQIANMRVQIGKMTTTPGSINVELLRKFYRQLGALKQKAGLSALRPVWLMLCALEGLMHQLSNKAIGADVSVFRTVEGALDFLDALCVPGLDPALATRRPVELLAVDDNAVCLTAVSIALRKAFRKPEVAAEGLSALAMAEKKRYDVIFLDVEMPGMNGFDLCAAIRKTDLNRTTPVVFVTSHGDFESRAKSALVGGQELIAKPFHSFEITVKALTLALRGRFEADAVASPAKAKETGDSHGNLVFSCLPGSPVPSKG